MSNIACYLIMFKLFYIFLFNSVTFAYNMDLLEFTIDYRVYSMFMALTVSRN